MHNTHDEGLVPSWDVGAHSVQVLTDFFFLFRRWLGSVFDVHVTYDPQNNTLCESGSKVIYLYIEL